MNSISFIFMTSASCLLISIGLLFNVFIVTKSFVCWWKDKTLQTVDMLMISLGMVRIVFLLIYVPAIYSLTDAEFSIEDKIYFQYIVTAVEFVAFCSLWWGTVLCVFYCVKITNYSNRLFMRLKMNISRMVPWLLLTSLLVSILSSLPCGWFLFSVHYMNSTQITNGTNDGNVTLGTNYKDIMIINFAGSFIPFLIFCVAISFLIASLLKHTRNMSSKDSGFTRPHLVAHVRAIINMTSFLLFYVLFFIAANLMPLSLHIQYPVYRRLCHLFCISYPSLHTIILIVSNGNLKRSIVSALCCKRKTSHN